MIITRGFVVSLSEPVLIPFPSLALQLKENKVSDAIPAKIKSLSLSMMNLLSYLSKKQCFVYEKPLALSRDL